MFRIGEGCTNEREAYIVAIFTFSSPGLKYYLIVKLEGVKVAYLKITK